MSSFLDDDNPLDDDLLLSPSERVKSKLSRRAKAKNKAPPMVEKKVSQESNSSADTPLLKVIYCQKIGYLWLVIWYN